jgi:hypothetical protein
MLGLSENWRMNRAMMQSYNCKQSDDVDELVAWMERLMQPYEFKGQWYVKHIDSFQIVPLGSGGYECIVVWSELKYEGDGE